MADLAEVIKRTLGELTENFRRASEDLHSVVGDLRDALRQASGLELRLSLRKMSEDVHGTQFSVTLSADGKSMYDLFSFHVPATGYPISAGNSPHAPISDRKGLEKLFAEEAANPDSQMMQLVSFLVRQQQKAHAQKK